MNNEDGATSLQYFPQQGSQSFNVTADFLRVKGILYDRFKIESACKFFLIFFFSILSGRRFEEIQ